MQPLTAQDPRTIGPFTLLGRLGAGGMGLVYLGRLPSDRRVAIKVVHEHFAQDPFFRERFAREIAAARTVGGFWTAAIIDADPNAPRPWLASQFIPGPTLEDAVSVHDPLPVEAARTVALGLLEALTAIHHATLVHRDLKPANVLLAEDGPRVIDFGIAHARSHSRLTAPGMTVGTPDYMSPEQASGEEHLGPASDIFAFGGVLVYASTGHPPFHGANYFATLELVRHSEANLSGVPSALMPTVTACLAKNPAARPTTQQLLAELSRPTPAQRTPGRRDRWWSRQPSHPLPEEPDQPSRH